MILKYDRKAHAEVLGLSRPDQLVFEQPSSRPAVEHKKEPAQFLFHTRLFYPNTVTDTVPLPTYDP